MVEIRLKNSKSRRVEVLEPIIPGKVSMYLCGPTVYDRAHIGNARSAVAFDLLFRLLRHVYGADNVTFVRNFTDVEDKINARAAEQGREISDLTSETAQWYLDDTRALGVLDPTHMPRATEFIEDMVTFIDDLIAKGFAYARDGHVLFRVRRYADYGKLSGRSVDDMIAGARVEVAPYKEDPMDFVLWKPSSDDIPGWPSPWGRGRPGWHIECSAMSYAILGEAFDIHAGGSDLLFPHHENEVAQSCAAGHAFANIWMHNEMLQVEGKKMSKSLGNFFTVRELLDKGIPGEVIRFVMLSTHYGKPMDWTEKKRAEAEQKLEKYARSLVLSHLKFTKDNWDTYVTDSTFAPSQKVVDALSNDLNTHLALTEIDALAKRSAGSDPSAANELLGSLRLMGFFNSVEQIARYAGPEGSLITEFGFEELEAKLSGLRRLAMETKDFSALDALKSGLIEAGVEVRMFKDSVNLVPGRNFDAAKLEGL